MVQFLVPCLEDIPWKYKCQVRYFSVKGRSGNIVPKQTWTLGVLLQTKKSYTVYLLE